MSSPAGPVAALGRALVALGSLGAAALSAHSVVNSRQLRQPDRHPPDPDEPVSLLLPLRNEAARVEPALRAALLALDHAGPTAELIVLDDGSDDGTGELVRNAVRDDRRARLVAGRPLPTGWLGKPHACQQLADLAQPGSRVLAFLDADVRLEPRAIAAAVDLLRRSGLQVVCPYPRQIADSPAERLVQPLLQWSWLTLLPLRLAESSPRPSLSAGNGQLMVVDRAAYERAGGHAAVRSDVLEDVALVRAIKAAGGRGGVVDGTELASCRMYDGWPELRDGYTKSLWAAFGSPGRSAGVAAGLGLLYLLPPVAAVVRRSHVGLLGYVAAVAGRAWCARRTGGRAWPDSLAHPASVALLTWLTGGSWRAWATGALSWRGRPIPSPGRPFE